MDLATPAGGLLEHSTGRSVNVNIAGYTGCEKASLDCKSLKRALEQPGLALRLYVRRGTVQCVSPDEIGENEVAFLLLRLIGG